MHPAPIASDRFGRRARSIAGANTMFDLQRFGRIEDLGLGFAWDGAMFEREVAHRAAILSQLGAGPGSVIAIFHSGTARFFADLFAVWRIGAAAACLDSSLTGAEL